LTQSNRLKKTRVVKPPRFEKEGTSLRERFRITFQKGQRKVDRIRAKMWEN